MSCNLVAKDINEGLVPEDAFLTDRASLPGEGSFVHVAWVLRRDIEDDVQSDDLRSNAWLCIIL